MNNLDKILKNKLENFQQSPPENVLNSIRSQYPKKSFVEFVTLNKFYFIIGLSAIIITGILLIDNSISKNDIQLNDKTITTTNNTNDNTQYKPHKTHEKTDIINETLETQPSDIKQVNNIKEKAETKQNKIKYANIFSFNDTSVCGKSINIRINSDIENYSFPGLSSEVNNNNILITAQKEGTYYIYFNKHSDNGIIKDSASIRFNELTNPNIKLSSTNLCYGENIILSFSKNTNLISTSFSVDALKINNTSFEISNLHPGENIINVIFTDNNNCSFTYTEDVIMHEKPIYEITNKPSVCSQKNGLLNIECKNVNSPIYTLNNELISESGKFNNLNPGIYYLEIKHDVNCYTYDTLLVRDSLHISPYFILDKDLIDSRKYHVRNMTKVDNNGYEENSDITFEWKINGETHITNDNPELTFDSQGKYTIELIAKLDEACESTYSETINVFSTCFRIPNIFTPNGDGIGDFFKVITETEIHDYCIKIINKLGEVVYESNDINGSWNGKINGNNDASEGLYYYLIKGEDMSKNKIEQKGTLQLVRN